VDVRAACRPARVARPVTWEARTRHALHTPKPLTLLCASALLLAVAASCGGSHPSHNAAPARRATDTWLRAAQRHTLHGPQRSSTPSLGEGSGSICSQKATQRSVWRRTTFGICATGTALYAIGNGAGVACSASCVEELTIVLTTRPDHLTEPCTLTAAGASRTAIYAFPPWASGNEPCTTIQGPKPSADGCARTFETSNFPLATDGAAASDASFQMADSFIVSFSDRGPPQDATPARLYFGGDTVQVALACGSTVVAMQQPRRFVCTHLG
jgi:hypothetical protein